MAASWVLSRLKAAPLPLLAACHHLYGELASWQHDGLPPGSSLLGGIHADHVCIVHRPREISRYETKIAKVNNFSGCFR
jgi:hypothetical protein